MEINQFIMECTAGSDSWPQDWHPLLRALALDYSGDWNAAHAIAQDVNSEQGSAVHAFLHRKEGVTWNAQYWYNIAGRKIFPGSLDEEWAALAAELLGSE